MILAAPVYVRRQAVRVNIEVNQAGLCSTSLAGGPAERARYHLPHLPYQGFVHFDNIPGEAAPGSPAVVLERPCWVSRIRLFSIDPPCDGLWAGKVRRVEGTYHEGYSWCTFDGPDSAEAHTSPDRMVLLYEILVNAGPTGRARLILAHPDDVTPQEVLEP